VNAKSTLRKIIFITIWLCIGGGMLSLLLAAITNRNKGKCSEVVINIEAGGAGTFLNKKDILQTLIKINGGTLKGMPVKSFDLQHIEEKIEDNKWVDNAETYFDNQGVLHVTIQEKLPVARIFTSSGKSFYIDGLGRSMPLSEMQSAKLPLFTGYPDIKEMNAKDSLLMNHIIRMASFILKDSFWMAQVQQLHITAERTFEITPLIGNQVIRMGNGEDVEEKFHRLFVFYRQVMSKTGFEKYKSIDVSFNGQVVASTQNSDSKVDRKQYKKYVEELIKESGKEPDETIMKVVERSRKYELKEDSVTVADPELNELEKKKQPVESKEGKNAKTGVTNIKHQVKEAGDEQKEVKEKTVEEKKVPKAVMPPRNHTEDKESEGEN